MKYEICDLVFTSKEKAFCHFKTHFEGIYNRNETLSEADKHMLRSLLSNRSDFNEEYLSNIVDYRLIRNPKNYNAMETQFKYKTGEEQEPVWIPFSLHRCIVGKGRTEQAKNKKTLREIIDPQIKKYRETHPNQICKLCLAKDAIQVDHFEPTFSEMVENFHNYHNIQPNSALTEQQISLFIEYHQNNANLRYLCASCNLQTYIASKGKGRPQKYSEEEYKEINRKRSKARYVPRLPRLLTPSANLT